MRRIGFAAAAVLAAFVSGCGPDYSPNTYAATAVQQANKVEKGVIVGVRQIQVSAQGVVGSATGAAAGGVVGSTVGGGTVSSTFGALGGGLVGGLIGSSVEHATGDTTAYEYIVRKPNNDLVSVTQKDAVPLALGQHVLVIAGTQARIVQDYTVNPEPTPPSGPAGEPTEPLPRAGDAATATQTEPPPVPVTSAPLPPVATPAPAPPAPLVTPAPRPGPATPLPI